MILYFFLFLAEMFYPYDLLYGLSYIIYHMSVSIFIEVRKFCFDEFTRILFFQQFTLPTIFSFFSDLRLKSPAHSLDRVSSRTFV